ncbi:nodulin homeobox isoform X2 [Amaranthus tricolor]|uniref:nodulin homeobox isoform X2 n=1 Tax=Amaranthus tricolor TaxID=29722 RepID=UPI00258D05C0|nr:nodulin homeobox isoform X2 [Amaranthus tricolor]
MQRNFGVKKQKEPPPPVQVSSARAVDLIQEVKELQRFNSQELSKLLKDSDNFTLHITTNGISMQIDMDKLVRFLPLHLNAVLLSSQRDEASLRHLLSGLRLLNTLCEIASRHPKLEQILLDDVKMSEQLLDLVFYSLIVSCKQEYSSSGAMPLLYSAVVACSMYLLTTCISSQWNELSYILLAHPKVDIFVDAAFGAVRKNINFLQIKLSTDENQFNSNLSQSADKIVNFYCLQCEASLQFLQSLCQNKSFRERLLRNKELCGKGGVLHLVQATLKLNILPLLDSISVVAAISRLKARVLSILLHLCEAESVSYLDEVASVPESLDLAKSVAVEVITLLKTMLSRDSKLLECHSGKAYPRGPLQLNALRLADIFSDDSNFRSYITTYFAEVLAAIVSNPYQQFLSSWCSSELPLKEEDALLEYEPYTMAGLILDLSSTLDTTNAKIYEPNIIPINNAQTSYAHQRTSLLVKVIANLHCFVPKICKEQERNFFLHKFLERLKFDWQDPQAGYSFCSETQKAAIICKNLRSLLGHAESLIPTFLKEEDVQLLRLFFTQLQSLIGPIDYEVNRALELQSARDCSLHRNVDLDYKTRHPNLREVTSENSAVPGVDTPCTKAETTAEVDGAGYEQKTFGNKSMRPLADGLAETQREAQNAETSGDSSSTTGKKPSGQVANGEISKSNGNFRKAVGRIQDDEKDEPDMHKSTTSLQSWANKLSIHGSEVTHMQLKNWLNNRKAKLARAAKDGRPTSEENTKADKQVTPLRRTISDSPESYNADFPVSSMANNHCQGSANGRTVGGIIMTQNLVGLHPESSSRLNMPNECPTSNVSCMNFAAGQDVVLTDTQGKEIAKGTVFQVEGEWQSCSLADTRTCVVDITELKSERLVSLPNASVEAGATFEQAGVKIGNMRVLWDSCRMLKR